MAYYYFNKETYKRLIRLWRRVCDVSTDNVTDEWLMGAFMPLKFIEDIERKLLEEKLKNGKH